MWLINLLGIVPIMVGLCFVALAWQGATHARLMYVSGRYPLVLFGSVVSLSSLFIAFVVFAGGALLLAYEWPFPIERIAP